MENKELPLSIIKALESGRFESLSLNLQKDVLEYMTATEFNDYQEYISDFQGADASLEGVLERSSSSSINALPKMDIGNSLSLWKAAIGLGLVALLSFYLGRVSVQNECPDQQNNVIFAFQDTLGSSLAEDTIQRKIWALFEKEVL